IASANNQHAYDLGKIIAGNEGAASFVQLNAYLKNSENQKYFQKVLDKSQYARYIQLRDLVAKIVTAPHFQNLPAFRLDSAKKELVEVPYE
ncbi:MAG: hypothetical protein V4691_04690, partial [Pseudomonadota bacterium]